MGLFNLFPTVVYQESTGIIPNKDEMSVLSSFQGIQSGLGNIQSDQPIFDLPGLDRIKNVIMKHIQIYFYEVMKVNQATEIYMTDNWLNYTQKGQEHKMHTHTNSIISAVYYLQVKNTVPCLSFNRQQPKFPLDFPHNSYDEKNADEWTIEVVEGDVVVFPSNVYHHVKPNYSDHARISIAVNTFVKGPIGSSLTGIDATIK